MPLRSALLAGLLSLVVLPAGADERLAFWQSRDSNYNQNIAGTTGYQGPGDIVSGAYLWYGLRAYNAAYASPGTNKSVNLRRSSDSATCDFVIASTGALGGTAGACAQGGGLSLAGFATTDATATCTISTTTATCTGGSGVSHQFSTIAGVGLTQPCYATAAGSGTSSAFTVALGGVGASPCGTVSVGETLTFTYGLFATEFYDQTGNLRPVLQATAADQLELFPSCLNGLPCASIVAAAASMTTSGNITPATGVLSYSVVAGARSNNIQGVRLIGEASPNNRFAVTTSANTWTLIVGSGFNMTASDTGVHAANAVMNGASSVVNIDGTDTTGTATGNTTAGTAGIMVGPAGTAITMFFMEGGLWDATAFSTGNRTSLCHNQFSYWGTASSC